MQIAGSIEMLENWKNGKRFHYSILPLFRPVVLAGTVDPIQVHGCAPNDAFAKTPGRLYGIRREGMVLGLDHNPVCMEERRCL